MKRIVLAVLASAVLGAAAAHAADKSYQVTGPVVEVGADSITVQKGKENWTIAKTAATKGGAEVKKGDKVTVYYTMTATEIEAKGGAKAEKKAARRSSGPRQTSGPGGARRRGRRASGRRVARGAGVR